MRGSEVSRGGRTGQPPVRDPSAVPPTLVDRVRPGASSRATTRCCSRSPIPISSRRGADAFSVRRARAEPGARPHLPDLTGVAVERRGGRAGRRRDRVALVELSRYDVPQAVLADVRDLCARYGRLRLEAGDAGLLRLSAPTGAARRGRAGRAGRAAAARPALGDRGDAAPPRTRAAQAGADRARLAGRGPRAVRGRDALEFALADELELRPYQREAAPRASDRRRGDRPAVRRGQDDRRPRRDRPAGVGDADRDQQFRVACRSGARSYGEHDGRRRGDRRVLGPRQGDPPGDADHLPDAHPPAAARRRSRTWTCSSSASGGS